MTTTISLSERFLSALDISVTELAALRGVSRQFATRDLDNFLGSSAGLSDLCRTLLVINTDSSRAMADRLRKFSTQELALEIAVGSAVSEANSKTYSQILTESNELWIWTEWPLELERSEFWDKLRAEFLDQKDKLLVYFVPTLEIADRLAARFETELFSRQYDSEVNPIPNAKAFGATVFIIATNLAASTPYVVLANPGSADLAKNLRQSVWALGKECQDLFELPSRFGHDLVQKARAAGLGVARSRENFFPIGQSLKEAGLPFKNYRNVDHLIGLRLDHPIGLFEGETIPRNLHDDQIKANIKDDHALEDGRDDPMPSHPLKFFPVFIRAYRKKAGDFSKILPKRKRAFFKF